MPRFEEPSFKARDLVGATERYRIVKFLGAGGMGEVYEAVDLDLGRTVALKVPLPRWQKDPAFRARLCGEVRSGSAINHPNVLRIHDLETHGDPPLLSMELIEGCSLHELLGRKLGRLTLGERHGIAIDICAGLAAIHDAGIVHRDLKPKNVMIDKSEGRAMITDFGLADSAVCFDDPASGTLEYLAPEQLDDQVSQQSDLFALGLVLYELYTGVRAYPAKSREELRKLHDEGPPSFDLGDETAVPDTVQKAIGACLQGEPEKRPPAQWVRDDLLARPIDDDVPTPVYRLLVMPEGQVRPIAAVGGLAAGVAGLLLVAGLSPWTQPAQIAVRGESPLALESQARHLAADLGFAARPGHRRFGYSYHPARAADPAIAGAAGPAPAVRFWYRQAPEPLVPVLQGSVFSSPEDPPPGPGTVRLDLRPDGRLLRLLAVPAADAAPDAGPEPDWRPWFAAAGLDPARFRRVQPGRLPTVFADRRAAWEAEAVATRGPPLRVEAASVGGRPVEFEVVAAAAAVSDRNVEREPLLSSRPAGIVFAFGFAALLAAVLLAAWRNFRRGIVDRAAALRLALLVMGARTVAGLLGADHDWNLEEMVLVRAVFARGLLSAALVWLIYVALEPTARHAWPRRTASWVRLLYHRFGDPLLGRDLLAGALAGIAVHLWARLYFLAAGWFGLGALRYDRTGPLVWLFGQRDVDLQLEALTGLRHVLSIELYAVTHGVLVAFFLMAGLLLIRYSLHSALRRPALEREISWTARSAAFLLLLVLTFPAAAHPALDLIAAAGASLLWLTVLLRWGFLAAVTATVVSWVLAGHPLALRTSGWSLAGIWLPIAAVTVILVCGYLAAAGRLRSSHRAGRSRRGIEAHWG